MRAETRIYLACASVLDWFQPIRPVLPFLPLPAFCFFFRPSFICLRQPHYIHNLPSSYSQRLGSLQSFELDFYAPLPPSFTHLTSPNRLVTFKHSLPQKGVSPNINIFTQTALQFPTAVSASHLAKRFYFFGSRHSYTNPLLRLIAQSQQYLI